MVQYQKICTGCSSWFFVLITHKTVIFAALLSTLNFWYFQSSFLILLLHILMQHHSIYDWLPLFQTMSPLDPNKPPCPQCGDSCSSAYRCRYCDCNIHVFCCLDYGRTAELGHGAHYRCSRPECILSRELVQLLNNCTLPKSIGKS